MTQVPGRSGDPLDVLATKIVARQADASAEREHDALDVLAMQFEALRPYEARGLTAHRIGHVTDPLGFTPRDICAWRHRWDDPLREYRTLYCAHSSATCLREVLADLRPSAKVLAEMAEIFGPSFDPAELDGMVSDEWLNSRSLVLATLWVSGPLFDIDNEELREELVRRHAKLLSAQGIEHLDISELRGAQREITQAISRSIWEMGGAGIIYRSHLDDEPCYALFEGRGHLQLANGDFDSVPDTLSRVLKTYRLRVTYGGAMGRFVRVHRTS